MRNTRTLIALAVTVLVALSGPTSAATAAASKKRCSAVQREFFPWECRY